MIKYFNFAIVKFTSQIKIKSDCNIINISLLTTLQYFNS